MSVRTLCKKGIALAKERCASPVRVQVLSARLLAYHAEYCDLLSSSLIHKANGNEEDSLAAMDNVRAHMSVSEPYTEPYYDFYQAIQRLTWLLEERGKKVLQIQ